MSADDTLSRPVSSEEAGSSDGRSTPDGGEAAAASNGDVAKPQSAAGEQEAPREVQAEAGAPPAQPRRPRLSPTVNPNQFKAVPSLKTLGSGTPRPAPASTGSEPPASPAPSAPKEVAREPVAAAQPARDEAEPSAPAESPAAQAGGGTESSPGAVEAAEAAAAPAPKAPPAEQEAPQRKAPPPVALPPAVESLDAEMEAEIEAALSSGELEMHREIAPAEGAAAPQGELPTEESLEPGAHLAGRIQSISGDNVFLDLGFRSPGVVSVRQFVSGKKPEEGQLIEVIVDRFDPAEGLVLVNLPRGMRKVAGNWEALSKGQIVDCVVNKTNKGGLEVTVSGLRGFLPSSQVEMSFVGDLEPYVGQKLRVQVVEVNPKKRNLVVSRRAYLQIERKEAEENLWKTLEVGQTFSGRVKTLKDYGAFIDLGGVDGFLHVGEISWQRIQKPSDLLQEGQQVDVKVLALDPEKKKISLGMRQLTQNPWATAAAKYPTGSKITGKVTRTADFGAFVELEPGLEGLIHISEIDYKHVRRVADVLKVHQVVEAQVLEVDADRKRVSLSLKALLAKPEPEKPDEEQAPSGGEPYQRKRKEPLKGGTGSSLGGGLFGNPNDFA